MSKNVLITGGSRGIGAALVEHMASKGMDVVFTYNSNEDRAREVAERVKELHGTKVHFLRCNVTSMDDCKNALEETLKLLGSLDVLVNNAGITKDQTLMSMSPDEWSDVVDTNLSGCFKMTKACIVTFLRAKRGSIINMASVSGVTGLPGQTNYSASKAGMIGFTKALAKEVAPRGVRVNAIAPGFISTEMTEKLSEKYRADATAKIPLKRFGTVDEVTGMVSFLVSDAGGYITGQTFVIDGGMSV